MERSWDPQVKKFFMRIVNTISMGLLWMMAAATAGLYFKLGYPNGHPVIYTVIFWAVLVITLVFLIRYFLKLWRKPEKPDQ